LTLIVIEGVDKYIMNRVSNIRRCPKCNGNIFFEPDYDTGLKEQARSWHGWCLQCGYTLYLRADHALTEEI